MLLYLCSVRQIKSRLSVRPMVCAFLPECVWRPDSVWVSTVVAGCAGCTLFRLLPLAYINTG